MEEVEKKEKKEHRHSSPTNVGSRRTLHSSATPYGLCGSSGGLGSGEWGDTVGMMELRPGESG